jgi:hypothetical protein
MVMMTIDECDAVYSGKGITSLAKEAVILLQGGRWRQQTSIRTRTWGNTAGKSNELS